MEEKILIQSEQYSAKKFFKNMVITGAILSGIVFLYLLVIWISDYSNYKETYLFHQKIGECPFEPFDRTCWDCGEIEDYPSALSYIFQMFVWCFYIPLSPIAAFSLIGGIISFLLRSYELTVSDKRIYGKVIFGKRVDLPVDSISSVGAGAFKRLTVATSSGRISFSFLKNRDEIQKCISDLLIDRQQKTKPAVVETVPATSNADELKKYKELLDSGIISQEEFDAKKKQLLGL